MLRVQRLFKLPFCTNPLGAPNNLEYLKERALIRLSGPDVADFLQGLITNDIRHLNGTPSSMYTMFLNTKGRVLYDAIIYKTAEHDTYLVETDRQGTDKLQKHLKLYRVRRKVDIAGLEDEYKIFCLFNVNVGDSKSTDSMMVPSEQMKTNETTGSSRIFKDLQIYRDPRVYELGFRIVAKSSTNVSEQIAEFAPLGANSNPQRNYRWLRYNFGVGEGVGDLPPETSFPLECNCDYLHGVSFHKGCYIGQELTARVHHTGVVRKRLMPIYFTKIPKADQSSNDSEIVHDKRKLGKLRGVEVNVGLGLLRVKDVLDLNEFTVGNGLGTTSRPNWWPIEAPKEKIHLQKLPD